MNNSQVYEPLNMQWKATCRAVFGSEIGDLEGCANWLREGIEPLAVKNSGYSGKKVHCLGGKYCSDAKFISLPEIDWNRKFEPLKEAELRDMDSIISAIDGRISYAGDLNFGNSQFCEGCTNASDSYFAYNSGRIDSSKNVAFSMSVRCSENIFGSSITAYCEFLIRSRILRGAKRCFEIWFSDQCSDCHYVFGASNCQDCMFCFNTKNKRYAIGNLELGKEKYGRVKNALIEQMLQDLEGKKRLPSILKIAGMGRGKPPMVKTRPEDGLDNDIADKGIIEEAFSKTSELLLGKRLEGVDRHAGWLKKGIAKVETVKSAVSSKPVLFGGYPDFEKMDKNRLVRLEEALAMGEQVKIGEKEISSITWGNIGETVGKVAFLTPELRWGNCKNNIRCPAGVNMLNCYESVATAETKQVAFCFWPRNSEHMFGSSMSFESSFCMRCSNSFKLKRCFECDSCRDCSGCYFCHNVENCQDCMFCFNAKNLKYAIGNVEVGREEYMKVKMKIMAQIAGELERTKNLKYDIYNIGCRGAK